MALSFCYRSFDNLTIIREQNYRSHIVTINIAKNGKLQKLTYQPKTKSYLTLSNNK